MDDTQTLKLRYRLEDLEEAEAGFQKRGEAFMVLGADGKGLREGLEVGLGEVVFWPEDGQAAAALLERARAGTPPLVSWDQAALEDVDWVKHWRRHFHWTQISKTLAVGPPWEEAPAADVLIRIDPGAAFGTGTHATTRLCLALLEEAMAERDRASVLDVGCGSGVLSIGARLLGGGEILGLEIEELALDECARNALLNEAPFKASLLPLAEVEGSWDIVIANILPHILIPMAPDLVARVGEGGRLLLSGVPARDQDFLERFQAACGVRLHLESSDSMDEWWGGCVVLEAR